MDGLLVLLSHSETHGLVFWASMENTGTIHQYPDGFVTQPVLESSFP